LSSLFLIPSSLLSDIADRGERGKRGAEYEALKQQWKDKCLWQLFRLFPQLRDRVDFADLSTPLLIEFYLREPGGGAVGLDHVPSRFTDWPIVERLQMKTEIGGLYLTGQDSLLCGQPIVLLAGL